MNLNSSPPFPKEQINNDQDHHHHTLNLGLNHQVVSSSWSSSPSCHFFFNPTQDHSGFYHRQLYHPHHLEDENYAYHGGSSYEIKNKVESSLKLALWKKEDQGPSQSVLENDNRVKWISSKMRMKKNIDRIAPTASIGTSKIIETDLSSNCSSYTPIRVCSDCHTTKTPLWRSGPKGPKSLCNACGIRQRKARRAMAAAAAAANGTVVAASDQPLSMKIKKRCKMANGGGSSENHGKKKKLNFEDFLINLSNKLALHRVFPQDEKDAAILLMALSSGLVHG